MNGIRINSRGVRTAGLALAVCVLAPLTASQATPGLDDSAADLETEVEAPLIELMPEAVPEAGFTEQFEPFAKDPTLAEASAGSVDLDTFEPPLEEPAPAVRSLGTGMASYYGKRFHGRRTANGERFNMNAMTAAHKTLPFGTRVLVTNQRNGRSVTVRINDRGPFIRGRTIDLSRAAAQKIGLIASGHGRVKLDIVQ